MTSIRMGSITYALKLKNAAIEVCRVVMERRKSAATTSDGQAKIKDKTTICDRTPR
jgi:hypothetical protein